MCERTTRDHHKQHHQQQQQQQRRNTVGSKTRPDQFRPTSFTLRPRLSIMHVHQLTYRWPSLWPAIVQTSETMSILLLLHLSLSPSPQRRLASSTDDTFIPHTNVIGLSLHFLPPRSTFLSRPLAQTPPLHPRHDHLPASCCLLHCCTLLSISLLPLPRTSDPVISSRQKSRVVQEETTSW